MKNLKNSKGFTLMEMLIVVAIIAILVAVAIPSFTKQLEKAREATDLANLRAAYTEVMLAGMGNEDPSKPFGNAYVGGTNMWREYVAATQKQPGWQGYTNPSVGSTQNVEAQTAPKYWLVEFDQENGRVNITLRSKKK